MGNLRYVDPRNAQSVPAATKPVGGETACSDGAQTSTRAKQCAAPLTRSAGGGGFCDRMPLLRSVLRRSQLVPLRRFGAEQVADEIVPAPADHVGLVPEAVAAIGQHE